MNTLISLFRKKITPFLFPEESLCFTVSTISSFTRKSERACLSIYGEWKWSSGPTLQEEKKTFYFFENPLFLSFFSLEDVSLLSNLSHAEYEQDNLRQSQNIRPSLPRDKHLSILIKKLFSLNLHPSCQQ